MKRFTRAIALLLAAFFAVALVGCSGIPVAGDEFVRIRENYASKWNPSISWRSVAGMYVIELAGKYDVYICSDSKSVYVFDVWPDEFGVHRPKRLVDATSYADDREYSYLVLDWVLHADSYRLPLILLRDGKVVGYVVITGNPPAIGVTAEEAKAICPGIDLEPVDDGRYGVQIPTSATPLYIVYTGFKVEEAVKYETNAPKLDALAAALRQK